MRKLTALRIFTYILLFFLKAKGQVYTPGNHYYGSNNYIEYIAGNMPVIISAPHGGTFIPASIADRTASSCFNDPNYTTAYDGNTQEIARALDTALRNYIGCRPHTIICKLSRTKVDCNRDINYGACGDSIAQKAWNDFHKYINIARSSVMANGTRGLYIDFHAQGHTVQRLELGYGPSAADLRQQDTYLNRNSIKNNSSIRNLAANNFNGQTHAQLLRGPYSFGTMMANAGYPSVPSTQDSFPLTSDLYFDGGYNIRRYGTADSGYIDAIQIESNYTNVRDSKAHIIKFADSLARVIVRYLQTNSIPLAQINQCLYVGISGNVYNAKGGTIPNVSMKLTGDNGDAATCDANGKYSFRELKAGNYTVRPLKNNDINKKNGVTVVDALLVQSHLLGNALLNSPYKLIAADVNNDGALSALDFALVKRFALGLDSSFPGKRLWAFIDSSYTFPDPTNPFPYKDSIAYKAIVSNKTKQSFVGVKLGDVNDDWSAAVLSTNITTAKPIELYYDNTNVHNAATIILPIRVKNFRGIKGMQFTLHYNPALLEIAGVRRKALEIDFATNHITEGSIPFLWIDNKGEAISLADSTIVMELVFTKKGWVQDEDIQVTNSIIPTEAWDNNFNKVEVVKSTGKMNDLVNAVDNNEGWEILPAAGNHIQIKWQLGSSKTLHLQLFTASGATISIETPRSISKGVSYQTINLTSNHHLAPGIYYLKANGLEGNNVRQVVIR
ncbi:dockerin type I domain-containing protein [Parasediminibacterium sp. JCM 36343]|uniref:dockerin type I domain-containing protein n=1 Tax=Parasediminibacterium sp. JCM 36343 TaxID=3374279 RepID=UPI00397AA3C3